MSEAASPGTCHEVTLTENFGKKLRSLREAARLTQRELADAAGMTQPAIARLESCGVVPTVHTLARLGSALGCDFSILVRGSSA